MYIMETEFDNTCLVEVARVNSNQGKLGILVGGGPAPGINSAIGAATIEATNSGLEVVGIYDGFQHLIEGSTEHTRTLAIADISRVHFQGGSILRTSRANPTRKPEDLQQAVQTLKELGIGYLLTIGGDDTALSSSKIFESQMPCCAAHHHNKIPPVSSTGILHQVPDQLGT